MLTQESAETKQITQKPRWPRAAVAFAATIVVVAAAAGIWALVQDGGPVAASDARVEITFTGDEVRYSGDREIVEGVGEVVMVNDSDEAAWFLLIWMQTGSAALADELAVLPEGGDFVSQNDGPSPNFVVAEAIDAGAEAVRPVVFRGDGTYLLDAATMDESGESERVWRAAVITVTAEE